MKKIAIAGTDYVGLSLAALLAQHDEVVAEKVVLLNRKQSPIEGAEIENFLRNKPLNFRATLDQREGDNKFFVIAKGRRAGHLHGCKPWL